MENTGRPKKDSTEIHMRMREAVADGIGEKSALFDRNR